MRHRTRATHPFKAVRRKLEIPPEWPEMCIWFDPRMHSEYIKWEDRFDFVVSQVDRRKRQVVRWFIVDVLENVHDPKELYRIWRAAGSNIGFSHEDGIRMCLEEILKRIDKSGYAPRSGQPAGPNNQPH